MAETVTLLKTEYESIKETLEIVSDNALMNDIREGIDDIRNGKTVSLDKYMEGKAKR